MSKRVAVLRMLEDVITEKLPFEQRSDQVMEQDMWISEGRLFQDEETATAQHEARLCLALWRNDDHCVWLV